MAKFWKRLESGVRGARRSKLEKISVASLAFLLALWLIENWIGERFWLILALTYLPQQPLILPTLLLLAFAAWRRDQRALLVNVLSLLFFAWSFGGVRVPLLHIAQQTLRAPPLFAPRLRVLTFNLNAGMRGVPGLLKAIREHNPDVICLQETRRFPGEKRLYQEIRAQLPAYTATMTHEVAIFSRYPVKKQRTIPLRNISDRAILETIIVFEGRRVRVFNIHVTAVNRSAFSPRFWPYADEIIPLENVWRRSQIETLLAQTSRLSDPTIICGDFNTPPRGHFYRQMRSHFTDVFAHAGWGAGNTFTSQWPLLRIDYIWSSSNWRIERCFVADRQASDHRAVVADFTLP